MGSFFGFDQGFDDFIELYERRESGRVKAIELIIPAEEVVQRAIDWTRNAPEPWLLVVVSIDPHSPYDPPVRFDLDRSEYDGPANGSREWINRRDLASSEKEHIRSLYLGEVAYGDHELERFLDHLDAAGQFDRTIFVLTSDHGEEFWEHGRRGHGRSLHDEVLHVPMILRYPPMIESGLRNEHPVSTIDLMPTILSLAKIPQPERLAGRDLLHDPKDGDEAGQIFSALALDGRDQLSVRDGSWKMIWDRALNTRELFDLSGGADAAQDLSDREPERTQRMAEALEDFLNESQLRARQLHGDLEGAEPNRGELSEDQRRLLEELGYLDDGEDQGH